MDFDPKKISTGAVEETINHTQRYNMQETYKAFTYYAGLTNLPNQLKSALADMSQEKQKELPNITSKEQIIQLAVEYLGRIDPRLKSIAQEVLNDYHIDKSGIQLAKENSPYSSTGRCVRAGDDEIKIEVTANRDASGIIAVGQELVKAGLFHKYYQHENAENSRAAEFARKSAKKFIGYMMVNSMAKDPYMDISSEQKDSLLGQLLNQDFEHIPALEKDIQIFQTFMLENHNEFGKNLEDFTKEDFERAMTNSMNNVSSLALNEDLKERQKEIAEQGLTTSYIVGEALETLVALQTVENCKNSPQADPVKLMMEGAINGYNVQSITGKTPEELANNSGELIKNTTHEQLQELENEEENVRVLERVKTIQNNISNNT